MMVYWNGKKSRRFIVPTIISLLVSVSAAYAQTTWVKDANNPVLRRDTVIASLPNDLYAISDCWVLKEGNTYKMWYTGGGFNYPTDTLMRSRICYATSTDGVTWDKYVANPVLDISYSGGWDSLGVETVSILIDSAAPSTERYKMWYAGQTFNDYRYEIGYAYSPDGLSWTKYPAPVLQVGAGSEWDNGFLEGPSVIKEGNSYKMWYCGYDVTVDGSGTDGRANIGYATSTDGILWTKYVNNPVIVTGVASWDSIYVQDPHVIKEGNEYRMWYGGGQNDTYYDQQVGYATSSDGINWSKSPLNPVLQRGDSGEWDQILSSFPSVLNDGGMYKMWYTGRDLDPLPAGSTNYYWEIGYATAETNGLLNLNLQSDVIILSPNPATNLLTVYFSNDVKNGKLSIYDSQGKLTYIHANVNGPILEIDLHDFENGTYIINIQSTEKQVNKRLILAR
jgi:predicted GH43/DUF377 family glycosyl hydrolase